MEGANELSKPEHPLCRLCRHPKIGSDQVRPNGLRGCKCDELSPYYNLSPPNTNLGSRGATSGCRKKLDDTQHGEKKVSENPDLPKHETCSVDAEPLKERSFVPPQGMDTGEYPKALFYQYYPNRTKSYTFDLLPLPFMESLKYREMRALSMDNEDVQEKWKEFLYMVPNSKFQSSTYPDDRFWRWKIYLRYRPDEERKEFRYKMQAGPKYDDMGRLPITGEDLHTFREIRTKPNHELKHFLKKGDGTRKK